MTAPPDSGVVDQALFKGRKIGEEEGGWRSEIESRNYGE